MEGGRKPRPSVRNAGEIDEEGGLLYVKLRKLINVIVSVI